MRASVIITDLTQMKSDRVCVAGYLDEEICVRPIFKNGGIRKDWLKKDNMVVIRPFHRIEFDFDSEGKALRRRPHTEDWLLRSKYCEYKGMLTYVEQISFLEKIDDGIINNIFGSEIFRDSGWYIKEGEGERSLGTIRTSGDLKIIYTYNNKLEYRISFTDQSGNYYNLAITDLTFRYFLDYLSFQKNMNFKDASEFVAEKLRNAEMVFVRIGLTRGTWHIHPGKCFLQVNAIYSFPDFLGGGSFADYELNCVGLTNISQISGSDDDHKSNEKECCKSLINSQSHESFSETNRRNLKNIKRKYPNAYKYWSNEENNILIELARSGKTIDEIAEKLQRRPSAIKSRIDKLNININFPYDFPYNITSIDEDNKLNKYDDPKNLGDILENAYTTQNRIAELRKQIRCLEWEYNNYIEEAKMHRIHQQGAYLLEISTRKRRKVDAVAFRELYPDAFVKLASIPVQAAEKEVGRNALEKVVTYIYREFYRITKTDGEVGETENLTKII